MLPILGSSHASISCVRERSLTPVSPGHCDQLAPVVTGLMDKPFVILSAVCCIQKERSGALIAFVLSLD